MLRKGPYFVFVFLLSAILAISWSTVWPQSSNVEVKPQVSAGGNHSVGLRTDGTVVAVGYNVIDLYNTGACNVGSWTDIVQIAAGTTHTVGLKSDGAVLATGSTYFGECDVESWTDIVQVAAGTHVTVGLRSDGTVIATGLNDRGQCDVETLTDIKQISCGEGFTSALKKDGTVQGIGDNSLGQCEYQYLTDIVQIDSGGQQTAALKSDGSAFLVVWGYTSQLEWENIIQVSAGGYPVAGLRSDGKVEIHGFDPSGWSVDCANWAEIIQISASTFHLLGLKRDGTVAAAGVDLGGWCNVGDWQLIAHMNVAIDIKPGSYPNSINLNSGGVVPVAIFGSADFSVSEIDPGTVSLAGASVLGQRNVLLSHLEDVDGDAYLDLVVQIDSTKLNLSENDTEATLTGQLINGKTFKGTDTVKVIAK